MEWVQNPNNSLVCQKIPHFGGPPVPRSESESGQWGTPINGGFFTNQTIMDVINECSLIRLHIDSMSTERFIIGQRALPSKMGLTVSLSLCFRRARTPFALALPHRRRVGRCGREKKGFFRMYSIVQKKSCMFEFPAFLPPTKH